MRQSEPLAQLVEHLRKLPGVGPKGAVRLAYHILRMNEPDAQGLVKAIQRGRSETKLCSICYSMTDRDPCEICTSPSRDSKIICVVEMPEDVQAMERSRGYKGKYHVLHGALSPLDGIGPEDLKVKELLIRLQSGEVEEVIVATDPDVEGEATATYLTRLIKPLGVQVSRIAHGLAVGSDLGLADEASISKALENRRNM